MNIFRTSLMELCIHAIMIQSVKKLNYYQNWSDWMCIYKYNNNNNKYEKKHGHLWFIKTQYDGIGIAFVYNMEVFVG